MENLNAKEMAFTDLEGTKKIYLFLIGALCIFGLIMVLSASFGYSKDIYGSSFHYFNRQLFFMIVGAGIAFVLSRMKLQVLVRNAELIHYCVIGAIILTFIPGIGVKIKGSHRWINMFFFAIQPAEFMKISIILPALSYFDKFNDRDLKMNAKHCIPLVFPLLLLLMQPDFGTFAICSLITVFIAMMSKLNRKSFLISLSGMTIFAVVALVSAPYRVRRLLAFLDPWKNPHGDSFQLIQSLQAFAGGGFIGKGIGNSVEKLHYLPEAHNDFIFSIVGEEFGFIGILLVILLFLSVLFFGFRLSVLVKKRLPCFIISTIVFLIGIQAFFNMGVVLGVLPTKGLNLPFISYGGSSLLANFIALGLVLSALNHDERIDEVTQKFQGYRRPV